MSGSSFSEVPSEVCRPLPLGKVIHEARAQVVGTAQHLSRRVERLIQVIRAERIFIARRPGDALDFRSHVGHRLDTARQSRIRLVPCVYIIKFAARWRLVDVRHHGRICEDFPVQRGVAADADMNRAAVLRRNRRAEAGEQVRARSGRSPVSSTTTRSNELDAPAVRSELRISTVPVLDSTRPGYGARRNRSPSRPDASAIASI